MLKLLDTSGTSDDLISRIENFFINNNDFISINVYHALKINDLDITEITSDTIKTADDEVLYDSLSRKDLVLVINNLNKFIEDNQYSTDNDEDAVIEDVDYLFDNEDNDDDDF